MTPLLLQSIFHGHPILYVLLFGMIGAKITNRLVVAHMCKGEITNRDASLLAPTLLILNQYFNTFIPETLLLYVSLVNNNHLFVWQPVTLPPHRFGSALTWCGIAVRSAWKFAII